MSPSLIFGSLNLTKAIAAYFGLINSVDSNVQKLLHQAFKSAIQNLEYAESAVKQNKMEYIKTAKDRFIDAIAVEENENLISAYVGLAMCQFYLGDLYNAQITLQKVDTVQLTRSAKNSAFWNGTNSKKNLLVKMSKWVQGSDYEVEIRVRLFNEFKADALQAKIN